MSRHQAGVNASDKDSASAANPAARPRRERNADWVWGANFDALYAEKAAAAREKRLLRAARPRKPKELTPEQKDMAAAALDRARSKQRLVDLRLDRGFVWHGGLVAGSPKYRVGAFTYEGFVSSEHPILRAFVSKLRRARHLRVGDHKAESLQVDSKLLAADAAYIEANARCCGVLRTELDAILSVDEIEDQCRASGTPLPNVVVGWRGQDGRYHLPHLVYVLHESVPLGGKGNARFLSLYRGVHRGLVKAFLDLGADVGGLTNCHRMKNPVSPLWSRHVLAEQPYDLSAMAQRVDVTVRMEALQAMAEARGASTGNEPDHPDAAVAAGSNRLFRELAAWAREAVKRVREVGGTEAEFDDLVAAHACHMAAAETGDAEKTEKLALQRAKAVAWWTWNVYRMPKERTVKTAQEKKASRAETARRIGVERRDRGEVVVIEKAVRLFRETGRRPTQASLTEALAGVEGASRATVRRRWQAVTAAVDAVEEVRTREVLVKKDPTGSANSRTVHGTAPNRPVGAAEPATEPETKATSTHVANKPSFVTEEAGLLTMNDRNASYRSALAGAGRGLAAINSDLSEIEDEEDEHWTSGTSFDFFVVAAPAF